MQILFIFAALLHPSHSILKSHIMKKIKSFALASLAAILLASCGNRDGLQPSPDYHHPKQPIGYKN